MTPFKKRTVVLLTTMTLGLAACSGATTASPSTAPTPITVTVTQTQAQETPTETPSMDMESSAPMETPTVPTDTSSTDTKSSSSSSSSSSSPSIQQPESDPSQDPLPPQTLSNSGITPGQVDTSATATYVESVIIDADKVWSTWMTGRGYPEPYVEYHLIKPGTSETFPAGCASKDKRRPDTEPTSTFDSAFPNAFYCDAPNARGELGLIILPVDTLAKMWSGDIIGTPSAVVGDFAAATVVSHEFGHHVAAEMGKDMNVKQPDGKNAELLADCFAGVWTTAIYQEGRLEEGDLDEAMAALAAVGDDPTKVAKSPHGTAAERVNAFKVGIYGLQSDPRGGIPGNCITNYWPGFSGPR